jgi:hypothetical protein
MEQHNLQMFQKMYAEILKNAHAIQYLQAEENLDTVMNDFCTLFIIGQGRETPTFKTIMDDSYHSECCRGICSIHLQIFLDNAKTTHFTTTIPRKLGDTFVTTYPAPLHQ